MTDNLFDVIVVGAGLTGLTTAFHLRKAGLKVLVVEKMDYVGGQMQTHRKNGFVYESGPNTGVISNPEVAELFEKLEESCKLEIAHEEAKRRLIWKKGRFVALPSGLLSAVFTPLFTFPDKLRILGEPFRAKGSNPQESVAQLAARRLGKSFVDYAVDPFLSGVYAGNPDTLITKYALPKLYNLEQNYGSFIKGSIALAKIPKTDYQKKATKKVFSVEGGLGNLPKALAENIGKENIRLSASNATINYENGLSISFTQNGTPQTFYAKNIVTTCGAYELPRLLPFADTQSMAKIENLRYAPVIQASVGIKGISQNDFKAFGGLVPSKENQDVLGILYPSACFDNRAPQDSVLFSFFIGGIRHKEMLDMNDSQLSAMIKNDICRMLKIKDPQIVHTEIFRHDKAIPQYELSSGERFKAIEALENQYPGLILAGNIRNGIGMADRIRQATEIAQNLTAQMNH